MIDWLLWVLGIPARDTRKELIEELSRLHQNHHRLKDSYNTLYEDYENRLKTITVLENRIANCCSRRSASAAVPEK